VLAMAWELTNPATPVTRILCIENSQLLQPATAGCAAHAEIFDRREGHSAQPFKTARAGAASQSLAIG